MIDLLSLGINPAIMAAMIPDMVRATPGENPAAGNESLFIKEAKKRAKDISNDESLEFLLAPAKTKPNNTVQGRAYNGQLMMQNQLGGHARPDDIKKAHAKGAMIPDDILESNRDLVYYNPNSDSAVFAHELGHGVSARSKIGKAVRGARGNQALMAALSMAGLLTAGGSAVMTEGDDDLLPSVLAAYGAAAPTLIDEGLATKNGLAIMQAAGKPATAKQKARLAGAFLTYGSAPLFAGIVPNKVGNLFDEDTQ